jgi:hypothetical protein
MALPWSFVSKITNTKHQITNKSKIPIFNDPNLPEQDIVWIFVFWSLEFVWYLWFDICNFNSMKFQQSKSLLGISKAWSSPAWRDLRWAKPVPRCGGFLTCHIGLILWNLLSLERIYYHLRISYINELLIFKVKFCGKFESTIKWSQSKVLVRHRYCT